MPSFHIEEVPDGSSFDEYADVMMKSWTTPRQANFEFAFPIKGSSKEAYDAAVEDLRKRLSSEHSQGPNFNNVQVVDDDSNGAIVAGAGFHIYKNNEENPHAKGPFPPTEQFIEWWPEGSDTRKFTAKMFDVNLAICRQRMRRPHICEYYLPNSFKHQSLILASCSRSFHRSKVQETRSRSVIPHTCLMCFLCVLDLSRFEWR